MAKNSKFKVKITKRDISGIESRMKIESGRGGLGGAQSFAFIAAALARLRKEAPEAGISKVEMSHADWKRSKERLKKDLAEVEVKKRKEGQEKGWDEDRIQEEIKSEKAWINLFQKSYLKDIDPERFEGDKYLEVSDKEWNNDVRDLKRLMDKEDWHNFIPRAGHMHNLSPERFENYILSLSSDEMDEVEEGILGEINVLKNSDPKTKKDGRKPNFWELASVTRYAVECFPSLKGRIEIGEKDWENMNDHLEKMKGKEGSKADYWAESYQLCNMKIIENMIKRGEVAGVEKK